MSGSNNDGSRPSFTGLQIGCPSGLPIPVVWGSPRRKPNLRWYLEMGAKRTGALPLYTGLQLSCVPAFSIPIHWEVTRRRRRDAEMRAAVALTRGRTMTAIGLAVYGRAS